MVRDVCLTQRSEHAQPDRLAGVAMVCFSRTVRARARPYRAQSLHVRLALQVLQNGWVYHLITQRNCCERCNPRTCPCRMT